MYPNIRLTILEIAKISTYDLLSLVLETIRTISGNR
jgi:hypothetical protein